LLIQLYGVAVTLSGGVTFVLLKAGERLRAAPGAREHELEGLDISQQGGALQ
jgi:ammonium transporter, Amt family